MRRMPYLADDTRRDRLAAVEEFDVNLFGPYSGSRQCHLHVCHEANWPAQVDISLSRDTDFVEHRLRHVTRRVEILGHLVARGRPAVTDLAKAVRKREHEPPDLSGER